jgi:hypothetical protein
MIFPAGRTCWAMALPMPSTSATANAEMRHAILVIDAPRLLAANRISTPPFAASLESGQ